MLYSAAGNSSDEAWYNKNIIAYDFECGVRQFSPTSTSNSGGDPGFTPNFATEGRAEGQEFADGMYGLMSSALEYQNDITAPVVTTSVPSGTVSQTPISLVFNESSRRTPTTRRTARPRPRPRPSTSSRASGSRRARPSPSRRHTTLKWFSVDPKGNTSAVQTAYFGVGDEKPVTTATLTPGIRNGWYASPTLTLSATSGGTGIAKIEYSLDGAPGWTTYTGPISGFTTGNHFVQYRATDNVGRVEDTKLLAFKVDAEKPTVNVSAPTTTADYKKDKVVEAKYKCTDRESGIDSCVGTVANGANLDTSTVGEHTFTVTGTDKAGNVTVVTRTYQVHYVWNGFVAPVSNSSDSELNLVHAGDLIQLKFGLGGDQGLSVLDGSPSSTPVPCPAWPPHSVPAAPAGSSSGLSYNPPNNQYRYGWETSTTWAGACRTFSLQLNDGTAPHTATFLFFS